MRGGEPSLQEKVWKGQRDSGSSSAPVPCGLRLGTPATLMLPLRAAGLTLGVGHAGRASPSSLASPAGCGAAPGLQRWFHEAVG